MDMQSSVMFPSEMNWRIALVSLLVMLCVFTYLYSYLKCIIGLRRNRKYGGEPPTVPYAILLFGHALSFALNMPLFLERIRYVPQGQLQRLYVLIAFISTSYGNSQPVAMQIGPDRIFMPADPHQNEVLLRSTKDLSNKPNVMLVVKTLFGIPQNALKWYAADDSGTAVKPLPESTTKPEDRIFFHQHHSSHKYLTGRALNLMTERFVASFSSQVENAAFGQEWTDMPGFWAFFRVLMFRASIEALYGPHLLRISPGLPEDFWEWDHYATTLLKGLPRWMIPKAFGARQRALDAIRKWHAFAKEHEDFTNVSAAAPEWEPYWGAKIFKARQLYMSKMHFMDAEATAAEDLGFMFASNANAVPATGWMSLFAFHDPQLLGRVRRDVEDSFVSGVAGEQSRKLDIDKLCSKPLLQSMYAECLRRNSGMLIGRTPRNGPFNLGKWLYPEGNLIMLSARAAAMNADIWNTGSPKDPRPLNEFWADRFVVYPDDPSSGPLKNPEPRTEKLERPEFSLRGLSGAWFPYGGGLLTCPGRHFAKNEIIAGLAVLVTSYDIELKVHHGFDPQPDMGYFPVRYRLANNPDASQADSFARLAYFQSRKRYHFASGGGCSL